MAPTRDVMAAAALSTGVSTARKDRLPRDGAHRLLAGHRGPRFRLRRPPHRSRCGAVSSAPSTASKTGSIPSSTAAVTSTATTSWSGHATPACWCPAPAFSRRSTVRTGTTNGTGTTSASGTSAKAARAAATPMSRPCRRCSRHGSPIRPRARSRGATLPSYSFSVSPAAGCQRIRRFSTRPTAPSRASAKTVSTRMPAITVLMSNEPSACRIR